MSIIASVLAATFAAMAPAAEAIQSGQTLYVTSSGYGAAVTTAFNKPGDFKILGTKTDDGSLVKLNLAGAPAAWKKAIFNIEEGNYEIGYIHFENAAVPDSNGAGIRLNPKSGKIRIHHARFTGCENGLLSGEGLAEIDIEDTVFDGNGRFTKSSEKGRTHNIYGGKSKRMSLTRVSSLNSQYGHDLKSRHLELTLRESEFKGSLEGRALDYPNGGVLYAENCVFWKSADAKQNNLIDIGAEGISDGRLEKYELRNVQFHNDVDILRDVQFINHRSNVEMVIYDPLFTGTATAKAISSTIKGKVRIVYTGGKLGPLKPVGGNPEGGNPPVAPTGGTPAPAPAPAPGTTAMELIGDPGEGVWTKIGNENDMITVAPNTVVRYGAKGKYVWAKVSGQFKADKAFFKSDPIGATAKIVESFAPAVILTPEPQPQPSDAMLAKVRELITMAEPDLMVSVTFARKPK
jgi:hypothetical protein